MTKKERQARVAKIVSTIAWREQSIGRGVLRMSGTLADMRVECSFRIRRKRGHEINRLRRMARHNIIVSLRYEFSRGGLVDTFADLNRWNIR